MQRANASYFSLSSLSIFFLNLYFFRAISSTGIFLFFAIFTIGLFDICAYLLVSDERVFALPFYRNRSHYLNIKEAVRLYPRHYHIADLQMGFDIALNQSATDFVMQDKTVTIFSNELGCMDHHNLAQIQQAPSYEYITGDSFTWGYADYDSKYPTVYEALTGKMVVKCGITHSGQAHQFEKFKRVVNVIGYYPRRVIVGYFLNDVINDYLYPHTTVVEGFQVDRMQVDTAYQIVSRDLSEVRKTILQNRGGVYPSSTDHFLVWIAAHSLSYNLLRFGKNQVTAWIHYQGLSNSINRESAQGLGNQSIYRLSDHVDLDQRYLTQKTTEANRQAITRWVNDAKIHSYELIFLLIPTKGEYAKTPAYPGLETYLKEQGVRYIDLAKAFGKTGEPAEKFYWQHDGHWNNEGNVFVSNYLAKELGN